MTVSESWRLLDRAGFATNPLNALCSRTSDLSYAQLHRVVTQRAEEFRQQGLAMDDVLLLPMAKDPSDVINVLAATTVTGATLLCSAQTPQTLLTQLQTQATVYLTDREQGNLIRLREGLDMALRTESEPRLGVLSSGSTGAPKRIWHRLSHFIHSAEGSNRLLPLSTAGFSLVSLPLHHVGGLGVVFRALLSGRPLLFDQPADDARTYQQYPIARVSLVPTQLHRLMQQSMPRKPRQVLLGGAPIPDTLITQARERGWQLHRSYGLSEMASQVMTEVSVNHWQCLPHVQCASRDGEILVQGDSLFLGYGDPWQPQHTLLDGWFATGDMAEFSGSRFRFIGRRDNQFISGGENVCPETIEQAFINAGLVNHIAIVPQADDEWGAKTVAVLDPVSGVNLKQLRDFARQQLLPHEQPKHYYRWQADAALKVQRPSLIAKVNNNDLDDLT